MSTYTITGWANISWEIAVSGSKNAALPLIASTLLFQHAELKNVPDISDVHLLCDILESLGSKTTFTDHILTVDNTHISLEGLNKDLFKTARATYYLIPPLLARFGNVSLRYPGGCSIGKRPIDGIVQGLQKFWYTSSQVDDMLSFSGQDNAEEVSVNAYFSVGSTIVLLLSALTRTQMTTIQLAAYEPHVMNIIDVMRLAGANIALRYDHTIIITPAPLASQMSWEVVGDYIVSGTLAVIGALTAQDFIDIHRARITDLTAFLFVIQKMGVRYECIGDTLRVYRAKTLKPTALQTNIYPGFPTDLQSPTSILMTQADGMSHIHEVLFEGRLNWLVELEKMRWHIALLNPHEALVFGKTPLRGTSVSSWDLRSWAAMLIAGMIASGETVLENVSHIERWYENFVAGLRSLGAKIQ